MIAGKITAQAGRSYQIALENGETIKVDERFLPEALRATGRQVQLLFGVFEEAKLAPEEARALVNYLLGAV